MTSLYSSSSAKDLPRLLQGRHQGVHFLGDVVDVEGCAGGGGNAKPAHQDLRAMMAGADADPVLVEHLGKIMGVDVRVPEGNGAPTQIGIVRPEHFGPSLGQPLDRVPG